MPVAITPTVVSPHSRAVRWAIPSAPKARPLTMHGGTDASPMASTSRRHQSRPYGLRSRVPTTAMQGRISKTAAGGEDALK